MRLLPTGLLVVANALWGSSYVVAKVALEEIPAPVLAALRFSVAAIVLWLILIARGRPKLPTPRDTGRLLGLGVLGIAVNGLLGYWGISLTTATDAALLIVGEVLFTMLLAVALAGERLTRVRGVGLLVGLIGVVILIGGAASGSNAPSRAMGDVLILVGVLFESAHTVLGTRLTQRYEPLVVLTFLLTGSCFVWLPVLGTYAASGQLGTPGLVAIMGVIYLALVTGVGCYLLWFSVLQRAGATLGALTLLVQPLVGAVLGVWLLGDPITPTTLVGGACVATCLLLASAHRRD